jgi:hypothetical protein
MVSKGRKALESSVLRRNSDEKRSREKEDANPCSNGDFCGDFIRFANHFSAISRKHCGSHSVNWYDYFIYFIGDPHC